jgi:hypothetical protein
MRRGPRSSRELARSARAAALVALTLTSCVARVTALADVPPGRADTPTAVFVLRSEECDANVAALGVFERAPIRDGVTLVGVVLLDGDSAASRVASQLRAFDVPTPVLRVSRATRDSLAALVRGAGPSIVVLHRRRGEATVVPAPQSLAESRRVVRTLTRLAETGGRP